MYSGPEIRPAPSAPAAANKSAIAIVASIACIGMLLFLIAATIILALIPIYVSNRSTAPSNAALRSKEIVLKVNPFSPTDVRGKRDSSDLTSFIGGMVGTDDLPQFGTALMSVLPTKTVGSIEMGSVGIANEDRAVSRKRRLSKRAIRAIIIIRFYIIFTRTCFYQCQLTRGPSLRQPLLAFPFFAFTNLRIIKNGIFFGYLPRLELVYVTYVSLILPGSSSGSPGTDPPTLAPTSNTTTTAMVTASMG